MKNQNKSAEIQDKMWEKWESFYGHSESIKGLTWEEFKNSFAAEGVKESELDSAFERFIFELKYLIRKPDYSSIKWLYGEHAMLYDVWGCEKHRFECVTHDDDRFMDIRSIFCPVCNEDKMTEENKNKYESLVGAKYHTPEMWAEIMKISKWHKDYNRKENIKYWFKKWTEKGYLKYRLITLFKSQ